MLALEDHPSESLFGYQDLAKIGMFSLPRAIACVSGPVATYWNTVLQ